MQIRQTIGDISLWPFARFDGRRKARMSFFAQVLVLVMIAKCSLIEYPKYLPCWLLQMKFLCYVIDHDLPLKRDMSQIILLLLVIFRTITHCEYNFLPPNPRHI